ncbi:MAG TPA: hypothetical protein VGF45_23410 [Polyangia bacterium]
MTAFLAASSPGPTMAQAADPMLPSENCGETMQKLKAAYIEDPRPSYLLAIANCARLLGHDLDAIRVYRSYLEKEPNSASRVQVEATIRQLESKVAAAATPPVSQPKLLARTPSPLASVSRAPEPPSPRNERHIWIWTTIGIVIAGAAGGFVLWSRRDPPCPRGFDCR